MKGKDLIFISRILRDGSGVELGILANEVQKLDEEEFELNPLSLTNSTWVASGFNSYVVKRKNFNKSLELTKNEEIAVLRRCIGSQQRDMNNLLKRIHQQQLALHNRKKEATNYHNLINWLIANNRLTKEECGYFIKGKNENKNNKVDM